MNNEVYTFKDIKHLIEKNRNDQDLTMEELHKLKLYVDRKEEVAHLAKGEWAERQLRRAKTVLKKESNKKEVIV